MCGSHLLMQVQDSATHGIAGSAIFDPKGELVLHVILGPDRALAKRALERALASENATSLDTDRIEAASSSFDAIFAAVTAAPFFGGRRVIVLGGMLAQGGKGGRGGKGKSESDLSRLVAAVPETTTLVLFDPDLGDLDASVKKQLPSDQPISVNDAPRGPALIELTMRIASDQGSKINGRIAKHLLDRSSGLLATGAPKSSVRPAACDRAT